MIWEESLAVIQEDKTCNVCGKKLKAGTYSYLIDKGEDKEYVCIDCWKESYGWNNFYKCYNNGNHCDPEKCDKDFI
jgi:hypothetical protein